MKSLFVIVPNLKGGGSERVISNIVKYLDKSKFNITLVLGEKVGDYVKDIPRDVTIIDLKKERVRHAISPIIKLIRSEKPDLVLSTLGHLNLLIALFRPFLPAKTKFIARESNTISIRNKDESYPKLFDFLFRTVYRNFDQVICQAKSMKLDLEDNYKFPSEKMVVINNPVDFDNIEKSQSKIPSFILPEDKINLIIAGRLSSQKRVDDAIKVMSLLPGNYHLSILGIGELEDEVKKLVRELNLSKKVTMRGFVKNPYAIFSQADFLLSTSRYEGFPNVVLEANACGLPTIAYSYSGGITEIIENAKNGFLVEEGNLKLLAKTILGTKKSDFNKKEIIDMTKDRFEVKKIVSLYQKEIDKI